jgi:hypothetical protein
MIWYLVKHRDFILTSSYQSSIIYLHQAQIKFYRFSNKNYIALKISILCDKGKGKVIPVLNWAPRHEGVLGKWRYSSTHSLTSALDGGEWSASRPGRFTPRERAPGTDWIGGWVGPRAVLGPMVKWRIPSPRRESNPRTPIITKFMSPLYLQLLFETSFEKG